MRSNLGRLRRTSSRSLVEQLATLTSVGDGSTLSLDFTTGVLDPRLTFTRDGGGTYVANDGYIYGMDLATSSSLAIGTGSKSVTLTATAGVDRRYLVGQTVWISNGTNNMRGPVTAYNASTQVLTINATATSGSGSFTSWTVGNASARFDYDPTAIGTPRGLLIEGSANNLCTWSQDFSNTNWLKDTDVASIPVVSVVSQTAPDGSSSVNRITFNKTGGAFSRIRQTISGTSGTTYTFSVWMKANTASGGASTQNVGLRIGADPAGFNCVVTTTWKRFSYSYALSSTDANPQILLWDNIVGNDETADVLVWGAQLEAGSGASSYIPTGANTGNRTGDSCALALSAIPFVTSEGSFVVRYDAPRANLGASFTSILNTDYQATKWIGLFQGVNSVTVSLGSWSNQTNISAGTVTSNIAAFSYGAWTGSNVPVSFVVNNSAVTNTTRDWNPALPTWLMIGAASAAGSSTSSRDYLNSCIRSVKYWPTRLPDAQLKSLTT